MYLSVGWPCICRFPYTIHYASQTPHSLTNLPPQNSAPVSHLLTTFLPSTTFAPIITRAFRPPKPSPAGILHIASAWDLSDGGDSLIMVGDSIDDMLAGRRAGAATVLLVNDVNRELATHEATDFVVRELSELVGVLEGGFEGRA